MGGIFGGAPKVAAPAPAPEVAPAAPVVSTESTKAASDDVLALTTANKKKAALKQSTETDTAPTLLGD
tara:strand:- start:13966 stop:14169 length:204 start_codon:yes stop_codon:yes gene_type:complete